MALKHGGAMAGLYHECAIIMVQTNARRGAGNTHGPTGKGLPMLDAKSTLGLGCAQGVAKIPLSGWRGIGLYALVDADRFDELSRFSWWLSAGGGYPTRTASCAEIAAGSIRNIALHRQVMGRMARRRDGLEVDHIDRDRLNNCRSNLRLVGRDVNAQNIGKAAKRRGRAEHTSRFKGVSWDKNTSRWLAQAVIRGRNRRLGVFDDEVVAARAYDAVALATWGDLAATNVSLGLLPPLTIDDCLFVLRPLHIKTSRYRGVSYHKRDRVWRANIQVCRRCIAIGSYQSEDEAAIAYDLAAVRLHGPRAKTNSSMGLLPEWSREATPIYTPQEAADA